MLILDQFGIIQNLQMSPIPQTSFLVGTFFVASYSKTALDLEYFYTTYYYYCARTTIEFNVAMFTNTAAEESNCNCN